MRSQAVGRRGRDGEVCAANTRVAPWAGALPAITDESGGGGTAQWGGSRISTKHVLNKSVEGLHGVSRE